MLSKHRTDPQKSLVGFVVGDVAYAVHISEVKEIINPIAMTALPHAPTAVAGVADHRGEVVPIIDLRTRFGLELSDNPSRSKWILVGVSSRTIGLVVDKVTEVFGTGGEELRPSPALGGGEDRRGIQGVTTHDGVLTFVLDTTRFESLTRALDQEQMHQAVKEKH